MRDRLPRVILFVISLPTNFVQSRPDFAITNLASPSQRKAGRCVVYRRGRWHSIFILLAVSSKVNRRQNWKSWVRHGEKLDNQAFHSLIINHFDNQTVTLPWLSRISDTSENQPKRLDSDNQINISTLICTLDFKYSHVTMYRLFIIVDKWEMGGIHKLGCRCSERLKLLLLLLL
jgi:hypothetical protein